jgi:pimeloyl-ACP methyl ester carboxylesterase
MARAHVTADAHARSARPPCSRRRAGAVICHIVGALALTQRASTAAASRRTIARVLLTLACALGAILVQGGAVAVAAATVELPVAFQVKNTNTSLAACTSGVPDGATYTIRGHISGPGRALLSGKARAITMYLFGFEAGEWNWDFKAVPGYDYAEEMARRSHVSLTLDELGYGASGHPANGNETCQGAEADIAHQIIQKLRQGEYTLGERPGIKFSTVVLAGHDVGGQVAEIEAYSYPDSINGLILAAWADQGQTPYIIKTNAVAANQYCDESASGYAHFVTEEEFRTVPFYNADPRVIEAADALRNPNPCGIIRSAGPSLAPDRAHMSQITVPVLIVFGDHDQEILTRQGEEEQEGDFSGSRDKTTVFTPEAGHFLMFSRTVPKFDKVMSNWLASRFPSP